MNGVEANREAELAHEAEELKRKIAEHKDAIHTLANRLQVVTLQLTALRKGQDDPG